jgi:hypothetical protein
MKLMKNCNIRYVLIHLDHDLGIIHSYNFTHCKGIKLVINHLKEKFQNTIDFSIQITYPEAKRDYKNIE